MNSFSLPQSLAKEPAELSRKRGVGTTKSQENKKDKDLIKMMIRHQLIMERQVSQLESATLDSFAVPESQVCSTLKEAQFKFRAAQQLL